MSGSFLGKQFSFAAGKSGVAATAAADVISTQPTPKSATEKPSQPFDARSDTSSTSTLTAGSVSASASSAASYSSKPSSSVLDTFEQEGKYKPVTNFEPQERVNPFDKGTIKTSATSNTIGSAASTTSSSSISSSSISSRINRNGGAIKSPPPPTGPPPPPPAAAMAASASSTYNNQSSTTTTPQSVSKNERAFNYGSSTSIDTITRMDTTVTTNTTTAGASADTATVPDAANNGSAGWKSNMGVRSASVYSAPAAMSSAVPAPGDTSGYASNSASNACNATTDLPSYTRPSYSRSESNGSNKQSDLDIIFGETKPAYGNGKYTRAGGSLSDAELIFGGPSNYKTDRFGTSKSLSVTSERASETGGGSSGPSSHRIYEGIQNAAFSDYSDAPTATPSAAHKTTGSMSSISSVSSITSYTAAGGAANRWGTTNEEEDEYDLK